ncbi:MAG: hypothetical protein COA79_08190 [Planctomycetota bacterium]|nr:MAG: hypothetical protein COA79_08190 [Planctomycetota bacterium]
MQISALQLNEKQKTFFEDEGYLVYPAFLSKDQTNKLMLELDQNTILRASGVYSKLELFEKIGWITSLPNLITIVSQLMEDSKFALHHLHAVKQETGEKGVNWHHDYEQIPVSNHSHKMVHCFFYVNGLNGQIGDLQILPKSHKGICDYSMPKVFGDQELPGSKTFSSLSAGTLVIVHSALWHRRRKSNLGSADYSRYFIDASYCEYGIKWPRSKRFDDYDQIAQESNFTDNGKYDYLYNKDLFFHYDDAVEFEKNNEGSYINRKEN